MLFIWIVFNDPHKTSSNNNAVFLIQANQNNRHLTIDSISLFHLIISLFLEEKFPIFILFFLGQFLTSKTTFEWSQGKRWWTFELPMKATRCKFLNFQSCNCEPSRYEAHQMKSNCAYSQFKSCKSASVWVGLSPNTLCNSVGSTWGFQIWTTCW